MVTFIRFFFYCRRPLNVHVPTSALDQLSSTDDSRQTRSGSPSSSAASAATCPRRTLWRFRRRFVFPDLACFVAAPKARPPSAMEDIALGPDAAAARQHPTRLDDSVAVMIRDAVKIYGKTNVVLRGLNMTVPKGKM